jgi:arylsulfatase A-like enzyme
LAKIPTPKQCDGSSLVKHLEDPALVTKRTSLTSFQFWGEKTPSHAVSDDRYRYISYGDGFEELYDLKEDPHEFKNLAKLTKYSQIKKRLLKSIPKDAAKISRIPKDSPHHKK